MSALALPPALAFDAAADFAAQVRRKAGPFGMVVAAHALLFYVVSSGLLARVADAALARPVQVTFVAPSAPPPAPPPAVPQTVALAQLPVPVVPPVPVIQLAPNEHAITLPQPVAAAPAEAVQAPAPVPAAVRAAPLQPAGPKTVSTGVEYIQPPQPVYPSQSRRLGEQGKVVLRVLVNEKGMPDRVLVEQSSGSARLDEAGRQAALRALFKPHIEDGRPVAVFVIVPLNFQLG